MRQPHEYLAIHKKATSVEPRLFRSVVRAMQKWRDEVLINSLAMAIEAKDVKRAERALELAFVVDSLLPASKIVEDTVLAGGRTGAIALKVSIR